MRSTRGLAEAVVIGLLMGSTGWASERASAPADPQSKAAGESGAKPDGAATIADTPQAYLDASINNAKRRMTGKYTGDGWTWHACFTMNGFIDSYLATREAAWLDARQGWLGPVAGQEGRLGEHPIGDPIMLDPMVRFAAVVLKDEPALAAKYGDRARAYVTLTRQLMFEKWEARGIWREDGPYGAFTGWPWYYTEQDANRWQPTGAGRDAITLPFNMQVHWGIVAARLHRITGEKAWRDKALRVFRFVKSRLVLYDDHYSWNYWEPLGPWDVDSNDAQAFRHWIGTHPYRDYQAGEVHAIVEAFHHGAVFDAQDMRRFVRTNTHVMWKGSLDDIQWNNSDAGVQKGAFGEVRLASKPTGIFNRYAGALWTDLAEFDPTARQIYERQLKPGTYEHAYYYNVTRKREPSYERRHRDLPADVLDVPFSPNCTLSMAAVMPSDIERGKPALVACQARVAGDLKIELRGEDGKQAVATLRKAGPHGPGILNLTWDAKDTKPGRYRIRWTLKDQYREFPVEVR